MPCQSEVPKLCQCAMAMPGLYGDPFFMQDFYIALSSGITFVYGAWVPAKSNYSLVMGNWKLNPPPIVFQTSNEN